MLQQWIKMANLVFELEKKLAQAELPGAKRVVAKMVQVLEEENMMMLNPLGEAFTETRTDVEGTIVGDAHGKLHITEVIKPVIYHREGGKNMLVQRGVVLVGGK